MSRGRNAVAAPAASARRPGRPRGPSQVPRLREQLVAEAAALYAHGGYSGISFGALAQRTGLKKATLFHYFRNKEALHWAVFNALGERLEATALGWFEPPPQSFSERLDRLVGSLMDFYATDPINARILCHGLLEQRRIPLESGLPILGGAPPVFEHFVRRFVAFLDAGIAAGDFYADPPLGTMISIGGVILFECMLPERRRPLGDRNRAIVLDERTRTITDFIRRAVVRPRTRFAERVRPRRRAVS